MSRTQTEWNDPFQTFSEAHALSFNHLTLIFETHSHIHKWSWFLDPRQVYETIPEEKGWGLSQCGLKPRHVKWGLKEGGKWVGFNSWMVWNWVSMGGIPLAVVNVCPFIHPEWVEGQGNTLFTCIDTKTTKSWILTLGIVLFSQPAHNGSCWEFELLWHLSLQHNYSVNNTSLDMWNKKNCFIHVEVVCLPFL